MNFDQYNEIALKLLLDGKIQSLDELTKFETSHVRNLERLAAVSSNTTNSSNMQDRDSLSAVKGSASSQTLQ